MNVVTYNPTAEQDTLDAFINGLMEIAMTLLQESQYQGLDLKAIRDQIATMQAKNDKNLEHLKTIIVHVAFNGNRQINNMSKYKTSFVTKLRAAVTAYGVQKSPKEQKTLTFPRFALLMPLQVVRVRASMGIDCPYTTLPTLSELTFFLGKANAEAWASEETFRALFIANMASVIPRAALAMYYLSRFMSIKFSITLTPRNQTLSKLDWSNKFSTTLNLVHQQFNAPTFDEAYKDACMAASKVPSQVFKAAVNEVAMEKYIQDYASNYIKQVATNDNNETAIV